jgi:NADPH2:quinone reductase
MPEIIRVRSFGPPQVLQIEDVPFMVPRSDQVLIRIVAFGINPVETYIRSGLYDPLPSLAYTPGTDGAGIIERVGEEVCDPKLHVGQRVWLTGSVSGTYAQYCISKPVDVHALPESLSFAQGAALGIPYRTAYRALVLIANAKRGESVLIRGATGGVGIAAIQFARSLEMSPIIATTSSSDPEVREMLLASGASEVTTHDTIDQTIKVNVIIENLANRNLALDVRTLKKNGRIVIVGNRGEVTINPRDLMRCEGSIHGMVGPGSLEDRSLIDAVIQDGIETGSLQPVIGQVYPFQEVASAHEEVMTHSRGTRGKVVVSV